MENIIDMRVGYLLDGFRMFIDHLKLTEDLSNFTVVEIGSYVGQSTTMFADEVKQVISVDPFMNDYDDNDGACHAADIPTVVYQKFLDNTSSYKNIAHIRKTSDDAINDLLGQQVDLIYIDGIHTYEQVKKDIENYRKILKPGGLMCGHDYTDYWKTVVAAVDETLGKPDLIFIDGSWIIKL